VLDAHLPAAHRVIFDVTFAGGQRALTRQSEIPLQMFFKFGRRRQQLHPLSNFDDALFAFAVLLTRSWDLHAGALREIEE